MKVREVQDRVALIAAMTGDEEAAHSAEDNLHADVLRAIADGARNGRALAREVLKTEDLDFRRWCA